MKVVIDLNGVRCLQCNAPKCNAISAIINDSPFKAVLVFKCSVCGYEACWNNNTGEILKLQLAKERGIVD